MFSQRLLIGIAFLASGCGRGNGLPSDLTSHLAARDINVRVLESDAPLSSRAGFIVIPPNPAVELVIIAEFGLKKIDRTDPSFALIAGRVSVTRGELWGITGRPAKLKLANGAQFEYLYLLTTDGRTYLFAEYAYG